MQIMLWAGSSQALKCQSKDEGNQFSERGHEQLRTAEIERDTIL